MRLLNKESFFVGMTYFLILMGIALWVRDIPDQPDVFSTTLLQIKEASTLGDPRSFAMAAIEIAENGWISDANMWVFNLWPPGFILLEAGIVKALGPDVPVILVLQILASALFSVVLLLLYGLLRKSIKPKLAFVLPLVIFAFPVSRVFLLEPLGLTLGESFSIGFFLLAVLLAIQSVMQVSVRYAVYSGLCVALSAYFRSQFELILLALTGWGFLFVMALWLTGIRKAYEPAVVRSTIKTIVVVLLVSNAATMPWRAYHWAIKGSPAWVYTASLTYRDSVKSDQFLESLGGHWLVVGGGNMVCQVDPSTCLDTEDGIDIYSEEYIDNKKRLFYKTFFENPVEWYSIKFENIGSYWFAHIGDWMLVTVEPAVIDTVMNGLLLVALIALVVLLFIRRVRLHSLWPVFVWFNVTLFSAYFVVFSLVHFEIRYFYFPKIAGVFMMIIAVGLYNQVRRGVRLVNNDSSNEKLNSE